MCIKLLMLGLIVLVAPVLSHANETADIHPYFRKRFFASLGVFFPDRKLEFALDASVPGNESIVDFSEQFGLDGTDETGALELGWRFREHWLFRAQFFTVDSATTAVLQQDVPWGDLIFNSGTSVVAGSDVSISRFFLGRHFRHNDVSEIGFGLGFHILDLEAFIRGNATIDGSDAGFRDGTVSESAPLPNLGAWYVHTMSPDWAFNLRVDWLSASVGDIDGRILNVAAGLNYAPTEHFGVGVSYNLFELDVTINDPGWRGRAINRFNGAYIYVIAYW